MGCSIASALQAHTHARLPVPEGQGQAQLVPAQVRRPTETNWKSLQETGPTSP